MGLGYQAYYSFVLFKFAVSSLKTTFFLGLQGQIIKIKTLFKPINDKIYFVISRPVLDKIGLIKAAEESGDGLEKYFKRRKKHHH